MTEHQGMRQIATAVCVLSLFAVGSITVTRAQQAQLPPGSVIYPVHFATGAFVVAAEDADTVRAVASKLKNDSKLAATIVGKADTVGSAELNQHLSQKRVEAVFEALVYTNAVPENRVEMRFTGEHVPVVSTADEQAELQNRVVAIVVH